jgi:hypothetical protein
MRVGRAESGYIEARFEAIDDPDTYSGSLDPNDVWPSFHG